MRTNRKKYDAILFDLDGTLLPMDNDEFTKEYFKLLVKVGARCGYQPDIFQQAIWKGVGAMVKNDGTCFNEERFWQAEAAFLGDGIYGFIPVFDEFYKDEFRKTRAFTRENPLAREAVELAGLLADKVILATNPLFPTAAVHERMSWVGLQPEDFVMITDYTNSGTCKPNPMYYAQIAEQLGLDPKKCLMVGNDAQEDMEASNAIGMEGFLVTDWLISNGEPVDCRKGSFVQLIEFFRNERDVWYKEEEM